MVHSVLEPELGPEQAAQVLLGPDLGPELGPKLGPKLKAQARFPEERLAHCWLARMLHPRLARHHLQKNCRCRCWLHCWSRPIHCRFRCAKMHCAMAG
jgi:hypothetical protein